MPVMLLYWLSVSPGFGLDTRPTPGPSLAVYDEAFLKGGAYHDAKDEGNVG